MRLSETRCTGRAHVVSRPHVDPLQRCDECGDHCDHHRDREKCNGDSMVIPSVTHGGTPLWEKKVHPTCAVPRPDTATYLLYMLSPRNPIWVILDRACRFCVPVDVGF